jgi:hypothetical protein
MSSRKRARSVATTPVTEPSAPPAARKVWIRHGVAQSPQMINMWRQGTFCDATITAEGRDFAVHRNVISTGSAFFYGAFTSGLAESDSACVSLPEMKAAAVDAVLSFLYTGECEVDEAELSSLLEASAYLQTGSLTEAVAAKLQQRLEPHTCLDAWALADTYSLKSLAAAAKETALKNFETVAGESGSSATQSPFGELPHARLLELLSDERLEVKREEAVHEAVVYWAKVQSSPPTDEALLPLFATVRYPLVSREFFEKLATREPLLQGALGARVFNAVAVAGIFPRSAEGLGPHAGRRQGFGPPSGILVDTFQVSELSGWTKHYEEPYEHATKASDLDSIPSSAEWVLVGARESGKAVLKVCAFGRRDEVLKRTARKNKPHEHNGAWWYFTDGRSFGFAPDSTIDQQIADIHNGDDPKRLSWHLEGDQGGYRAGDRRSYSTMFTKLVYYRTA